MNHTTQVFTRTARQSGTERAASIYRARRRDWSGVWIVGGCIVIMCATFLFAWSQS